MDGDLKLRAASPANLELLLPLVRAYHAFEQIDRSEVQRADAVRTLLTDDRLGGIWLLVPGDDAVGYLALTYGYSIEFGGRDAFIDEFYVDETHRGRGYGRTALRMIQDIAAAAGVQALHLEVARDNLNATRLYSACGFQARGRFQLMSARLNRTQK